jgi:hypothetical protein
VKYIKEFKATPRNICVLMMDRFQRDLENLRKDVREALNLLEQQTYIQRNGEVYEFLTVEEKDVEEEIKNTEVEAGEVADELAKIIFDHIIKTNKIRFQENGQDYPFLRRLDDRSMGREHELAIHVVSPFHEHYEKVDNLKAQSMLRDELLVFMPPDERLVSDILMYKRTEKYIRQNISITQRDAVKRILTDRSFRNRERYADLQQRVRTLLGKARLFVRGYEIEVAGEDPQVRINRGFFELINQTYPNLRMLRNITYTENDIARYLQPVSLFGGDAIEMSEAEQEMAAFIQANNKSGIRTTLKGLVERFERKPYGWYLAAILCILARLCARGKIDVRQEANILENAELERALRNSKQHVNLVLVPLVEYTASQVRQLKNFYNDFFDAPPRADDARELGKETAAAFRETARALEQLAAEATRFPFSGEIRKALKHVKELEDKPYNFYLDQLAGREDTLMDLKEAVLDPVRLFMSGPKKELYEEALKFQQDQGANFSYVDGDEHLKISEILSDPECFKGNRMQQVKALVDSLKTKVSEQFRQEKEKAVEAITALKEKMTAMQEFAALSPDRQSGLTQAFNRVIRDIKDQSLIAVIRDKRRQFEEREYQQLLSRMTDKDKVEYISIRSISAAFDKVCLADERDVDGYLAALKEALMKEIARGKRVRV